MKHIIYMTTNLVNGKIYIGAHSTNDLNDGYIGSGVGLKRAVRKYGRENFSCQVLCECSSSGEMYELEALTVDEEFVNRRDTYNMCLGGHGGSIHLMISGETRSKMSRAKKGVCGELHNFYGKRHSEESKEKMRQANLGKKHTQETKAKMCMNNSGRSNPNHNYLWHTPKGVFESAYHAAEVFGVDRKTIEQRCNKGFEGAKVRGKDYTWRDLGWDKEALN